MLIDRGGVPHSVPSDRRARAEEAAVRLQAPTHSNLVRLRGTGENR